MLRNKPTPESLRGVGQWKTLETVGDCKRLFRWLILALKDGKLSGYQASVMGQLGTYLLKAIEGSDLEQRLAALERALQQGSDHHESRQTH